MAPPKPPPLKYYFTIEKLLEKGLIKEEAISL